MPGIRFLFGDTCLSNKTIDELIKDNEDLSKDKIEPMQIIPKDYVYAEERNKDVIRQYLSRCGYYNS